MAYEDTSPYSSCPWITFHANALTLLDTLYGETCNPETKITRFITAVKRRFARSPTRGKKSKKQASKVIHIPGESFSRQQHSATNRSSRQPAPTSCRDRSPTPHPFSRDKADTRDKQQPASKGHRARSPTPPWRHRNANTRTFSQSTQHSFHIDTIQLNHSLPHSTESHSLNTSKSSLQDHPRCIPRSSTRKRISSSRIPILSKLRCHNSASSHKNKSLSRFKGASRIPVPHGKKIHMSMSTVEDNTDDEGSIHSDTSSVDSICDPIEMPRDITSMGKFCNSQGDTPIDTQDQDPSATMQDPSATVQPKQRRTSQTSEISPSRTLPSSQNTYNHIKQYIARPSSAKYHIRPPPLLHKAITSRPQHMASSKQWPALLPTPACSRSSIIPTSRQQLPVPSPAFNHFTTPVYHPLYLPVIILTLTDKFTKLLCQQGYPDTTHHKQYVHKGIQTDTITSL